MAQPQPQYPLSRPFSPPQSSTSPGPQGQFGYPPNPNKRQRLSPGPSSQPGSPYVQSPYSTMSPNTPAPQSAGASPHFTNVALPPNAFQREGANVYNTPYSNGNTTPTLSLPQSQPNQQNQHNPQHQSSLSFPSQNQTHQQPNYNNFTMSMPAHGMPGPGAMGPPSKPIEKAKEDGVDVMDVLGGTGIDLREEEQYTFQMYNTSFNSQLSNSQSGTISSGHSFTQFAPGDAASFYGSGPANATAEKAFTSQDEYHQKVADKAWHDAAHNLAVSRQRELQNPFLQVQVVQAKMSKIARENGLALKTDNNKMGTMKLPDNFSGREIQVNTVVGPDAAFTVTSGNFVPLDAYLVDHVALLSIASKHRLRTLVEDAMKLAKGRQTGTHGVVPEEWADVAVPIDAASSSAVAEGAPRSGWESAVSPGSNPLKRSFSAANYPPTPISSGTKTPNNANSKFSNAVVAAMRDEARRERDIEEARLRKRIARTTGVEAPTRQSSIVPGTPGSVAPDSIEKAPTKKEQKKKAEAKVNEAANHAAANTTTAQFLGGGGGLFGKKKKYSWMSQIGGGSGSGASTPGRINTQGLPGTPGAPVAPTELTVKGVRRLGEWRENGDKGAGIQMRDWIVVLEQDGHEKKALQKAYQFLDQSEPK